MGKGRPFLKLYNDILEAVVVPSTIDECGHLLKAIEAYNKKGYLTPDEEAAYLIDSIRYPWYLLQQNLDRALEAAAKAAAVSAENGAKNTGNNAVVCSPQSQESSAVSATDNLAGPSGTQRDLMGPASKLEIEIEREKEIENHSLSLSQGFSAATNRNESKPKRHITDDDIERAIEKAAAVHSLTDSGDIRPTDDEVIAFFIEHNDRPELNAEEVAIKFVSFCDTYRWSRDWKGKALEWIRNEVVLPSRKPSSGKKKAKAGTGSAAGYEQTQLPDSDFDKMNVDLDMPTVEEVKSLAAYANMEIFVDDVMKALEGLRRTRAVTEADVKQSIIQHARNLTEEQRKAFLKKYEK